MRITGNMVAVDSRSWNELLVLMQLHWRITLN